jgi:hypothetical protein
MPRSTGCHPARGRAATARAASDIAERLGLVEAAIDARVTIGTTRYLAGDPGGLPDLERALETCRRNGLPIWRRAAMNLAYAMCEEGNLLASHTLRSEVIASLPPDSAMRLSDDAWRAYLDGDWHRLLAVTANFEAAAGVRWNAPERYVCIWVRILRGEDLKQPFEDQLTDTLAAATFEHRLDWVRLANVALIRALQSQHEEATLLLTRLVTAWRKNPGIVSGQWAAPASHAAALAGQPACHLLHAALTEANRRTPWVQAAIHTTIGGATHNDPETAFSSHIAAADIYHRLPDISDRMLALAAAHRSLGQHPHPPATKSRRELEAFAHQAEAPGLLAIAGLVTQHITPTGVPDVAHAKSTRQ